MDAKNEDVTSNYSRFIMSTDTQTDASENTTSLAITVGN